MSIYTPITPNSDEKVPPHVFNLRAEFLYVLAAFENGLYFLDHWDSSRMSENPDDELLETACCHFDIVVAFANKSRHYSELVPDAPNFFHESIIALAASTEQRTFRDMLALAKSVEGKLADIATASGHEDKALRPFLDKVIQLIERRAGVEVLISTTTRMIECGGGFPKTGAALH